MHSWVIWDLKGHTAAAKSLQSCPILCDPIDTSPPGSPVPGILQARALERVAISFSNAWKWKVKGKSLSCVWLFTTPWTAAYQAPPSMGFSRQEYWSGVPLPSPTLAMWNVPNVALNSLCKWTLSNALYSFCLQFYIFCLDFHDISDPSLFHLVWKWKTYIAKLMEKLGKQL